MITQYHEAYTLKQLEASIKQFCQENPTYTIYQMGTIMLTKDGYYGTIVIYQS